MKQQIKNLFTDAVIFECELPEEIAKLSAGRRLGYAIKEALKAGANLADANLADANLAGANLADANLTGANLTGAYLAGANLTGANLAGAYLADAYLADAYLTGANLADAYLADAYLTGANLADAYLADAYLTGANLADANLTGAYLAGAYLADANLAGANLAGAYLADANLAGAYLAGAKNVGETNSSESAQPADPVTPYERKPPAQRYAERAARFRERNPDVPVIENLDARILGLIESGEGKLEMSTWHTCETTHCMAGWAIHLAGEQGKELQAKHGPQFAGHKLYMAAIGRAPHFFATNESALEALRERVRNA